MPHGKDVFAYACREMERAAGEILARNSLIASDLAAFIPHQANRRIVDRVAEAMRVPKCRVAITLDTLGNTGCASIPVTLFRHKHLLPRGGLVLLVAFGGGYSSASALLRRC